MENRQNIEENEMSFLQHLEALRWHLVRSVLAVMVLAITAFVFHKIIFDEIIIAPKTPEFFTNRLLCQFGTWVGVEKLCINRQPFDIINIKMAGQFSTHIMVSLVLGLVIAFPYIIYEVWSFIKPGLRKSERKKSRGGIVYSSLLFLLGVAFGYYIIVPLSVHFLGSYTVSEQVNNQINLSSYISTVTSVVLASGVIFELPILVFFLSKIGLVSPEFLRKYRKHSLIIILALSAIITPPDIFSQVLVSVPLLILYEVGIAISKRVTKKSDEILES
ncbi:MAG: twin-arginine translocase subunit TatC [Bacteroidetes bacterium]|jgi:sec-independent protein translocase protein TatC|nr:twin-arginine translocase subunit TatC [Bacteroidota bacterium]MBT6687576.1 twin-arginine translocase subunit TatC [Bacteroidota bacterium]MBT7142807.1 twin-arginine translocase subunit TatC [Bacteroidota bacterium]MBT7492010.1 twin-arginine translocase subunit TatC [Bacteroidota bacterium]